MLQRTEHIPLVFQGQRDTLERLIDQVQSPLPTDAFTLAEAATALIEASLARGWIYSAELRELIAGMDHRLVGFAIDELAQVFDFEELQVWANSRQSIPTRSYGAVAMRDAAFLLIQLKAMGFRVDDAPVSSSMRPLLAAKKVLVGREFYVFWQKELEAKREAFVLYSAPVPPKVTTKEMTLPLGQLMRVVYSQDRTIGVEVAAVGGGAQT